MEGFEHSRGGFGPQNDARPSKGPMILQGSATSTGYTATSTGYTATSTGYTATSTGYTATSTGYTATSTGYTNHAHTTPHHPLRVATAVILEKRCEDCAMVPAGIIFLGTNGIDRPWKFNEWIPTIQKPFLENCLISY